MQLKTNLRNEAIRAGSQQDGDRIALITEDGEDALIQLTNQMRRPRMTRMLYKYVYSLLTIQLPVLHHRSAQPFRELTSQCDMLNIMVPR